MTMMRRREAKRRTLFPDVDTPAAVADAWIVDGSPLPVPRFDLTCPACAGGVVLVKSWRYHERPETTGSAMPWRCDVAVKCCSCSHVWWYGLALTRAQWLARPADARPLVGWRRGFELLRSAWIVDDDGRVRDEGP